MPISDCMIRECFDLIVWNRYSVGAEYSTMLPLIAVSPSRISRMQAEKVVDLPEPVGPAIRKEPWVTANRSRRLSGKPT